MPNNTQKKKKEKSTPKNSIWIGKLQGTDYYLLPDRYFDNTEEARQYIKDAVRLCDEYSVCNDGVFYTIPAPYSQRFYSVWKDKFAGLGDLHGCYSIISRIRGKYKGGDAIVEEIKFYQPAIKICKLILEELSNV